MAVSKKKARSALGNVPLNQGIFSKTELETEEKKNQESNNQESRIENKESRVNDKESFFLNESEKEKVNFRIPIYLNDWLDDLVKQGKRRHGSKIPKEIWVQAALELFKNLPVNWEEIKSTEDLRDKLIFIESSFKSKDS